MGDTKNNLFNQKLNLSTLFFARPMMYSLNTFGKSTIVDIRNKHYETGFNKCELDEDYYKEGRMFLTYNNKKGHKNFPIRNWQFFLDSVRKSKLYINEFDSDINFTTFYLNFPERWLNDYKNIIEGNYSKVSYNFMSTFFPDNNNLLYHLRNKTSEAKGFYAKEFGVRESVFDDCEIGPKMIIEKEMLKIDNNLTV
jgi:hypothetical protein